jgi:hypothetical protein
VTFVAVTKTVGTMRSEAESGLRLFGEAGCRRKKRLEDEIRSMDENSSGI